MAGRGQALPHVEPMATREEVGQTGGRGLFWGYPCRTGVGVEPGIALWAVHRLVFRRTDVEGEDRVVARRPGVVRQQLQHLPPGRNPVEVRVAEVCIVNVASTLLRAEGNRAEKLAVGGPIRQAITVEPGGREREPAFLPDRGGLPGPLKERLALQNAPVLSNAHVTAHLNLDLPRAQKCKDIGLSPLCDVNGGGWNTL